MEASEKESTTSTFTKVLTEEDLKASLPEKVPLQNLVLHSIRDGVRIETQVYNFSSNMNSLESGFPI